MKENSNKILTNNYNGKHGNGFHPAYGKENLFSASQIFYERLMIREDPEYFTHIGETIITNVERISRIFSLTPQDENILVEMALLQFNEESNGIQGSLKISVAHPSLTSNAPLQQYGLIIVNAVDESHHPEFIIPQRMMNEFLGVEDIDKIICKMTTPVSSPYGLIQSRVEFARNLAGILQNEKKQIDVESHPEPIVIELTGNDHKDLQSVATLVLQESGHTPRLLRLRSIFHSPETQELFIRIWNRDSRISPIAAIIELSGEESPQEYQEVIELISALYSPVILISPGVRTGYRNKFINFPLPETEHLEQEELWKKALASTEGRLDSHIYEITNNFLLKPADIRRISAFALAGDPNGENVESMAIQLRREARKACRPPIQDLATLIEPTITLHNLAVSDKATETLQEIINRVKTNRKALYDFGFKEKFRKGLAVTALFYGESGTGKTHAAEAIAGELGLDLYQIDLSRVISKYVGETEKNLSRIFDGARNSGAVLLFDEADALFGKRSEVADAHDRYANQEVSFLLQKMEEYVGLSILTTNLADNMDDAFNRRINYRIVFTVPNIESRKRIWERIYPAKTPTHNLNYEELAEELEITGAEIKNLAIRAAYIAAGNDEPVKMKHIRMVLKDELDKIDIIIKDSDLPHWYKDE